MFLIAGLTEISIIEARGQEIRQPLPNGSSNAALHYLRAILLLADVDPESKSLLEKPLWEIVTPQMTEQQRGLISQLLFSGRHAVRATMMGAQQNSADFGADPRAYGAAILLPHVEPMHHLAQLVAIYGMYEQGEKKWAEAAETFLSVIRMGHHLTDQLTLGESTKGIRVLESGYYSLVTWATRCPDPNLIASARQSLLAVSADGVSPLAALGNEAAIVDLRLSQLQNAYPDGNWPEILLAATAAVPETDDVTDWPEFAKSQVIKRGVPASVFESEQDFNKYIESMRTLNQQYYANTIAALALPPEQAIAKGEVVYREFAGQLVRLGNADALNPGQIAAFYATHESGLRLLNITLAICAQREGKLYPQDLSSVASLFGGQIPVSSVGQKSVIYKVSADRTGFRISFPSIKVGETQVSEVAFEHNFVVGK